MALKSVVSFSSATYQPVGDCAVLAEFGEGIDEGVNLRVRSFDEALQLARLPEILEAVPAYQSILILYDPVGTSYDALIEKLKVVEKRSSEVQLPSPVLRRIPVVYGGDCGPDIATVAAHNRIRIEDVIRLHTSSRYLVYMTGFTPGFPYMGGLPQELSTPRLKVPRLRVAAGSVGIAGTQTGIYPLESPGGWQIIGRTPTHLFRPDKPDPVLLHPGDLVEFYSVGEAEFETVSSPAAANTDTNCTNSGRKTCGPVLRVLQPGILATIQDLGRHGFLRTGIPASGATDAYALAAANLLVGNREGDAALEITLWGAQFEFLDRTWVAIAGAHMQPRLNGQPVPLWQSILAERGNRLTFGASRNGCRAYLALAGGIAVPQFLGSRSTFLRARLGGFQGRGLAAGDELSVFASSSLAGALCRQAPSDLRPVYAGIAVLRVVLGPQEKAFTSEGIRTFLNSEYRVSPASDRMGIRLSGPVIEHRSGPDIVTDATVSGAIQVPGDGQPILLLSDRQTTGGYAKIAAVITADLDRAGQLKPGDGVRFCETDIEGAHRAYREYVAGLRRLRCLLTV